MEKYSVKENSKIVFESDVLSEHLCGGKSISNDFDFNRESESIKDEYMSNEYSSSVKNIDNEINSDNILDEEIIEETNLSPTCKNSLNDNMEIYNLSISDHDSKVCDDILTRALHSIKTQESMIINSIKHKLKKSDLYDMTIERFKTLTTNDVSLLLCLLGLAHYANTLQEFDINGNTLLNCTELDLIRLGLNYQPHRSKLIKFLEKLRLRDAATAANDKNNHTIKISDWGQSQEKVISNEITHKLYFKKEKAYALKNPLESTLKYLRTMENDIDPNLLLSYDTYRDKNKLNYTILRQDKRHMDKNLFIKRESYAHKLKKHVHDNRKSIFENVMYQGEKTEIGSSIIQMADHGITGSMNFAVSLLDNYDDDNYDDENFENSKDDSVKSRFSSVTEICFDNDNIINSVNNQNNGEYLELSYDMTKLINEQNNRNSDHSVDLKNDAINLLDQNYQNNSISKIQCHWRRFIATKRVNNLRHKRQELKKQLARISVEVNRTKLKKQNAAVKIQCFVRSRIAQNILKTLKLEFENMKYNQKLYFKNTIRTKRQTYKQNQAAIKIQNRFYTSFHTKTTNIIFFLQVSSFFSGSFVT